MSLDETNEDLYREYGDIAATVLRHVETGTTDQAPDVLRVPVANYLDPARWRLEIDRVFMRLPLMLALSIELPRPGEYKAMDAVGKPVLITRASDGKARAFLNVCKHRGMHIVGEGRGKCARFTCQYHGWTYANDGRLVGIAERRTFGEVDKSSLHLTELPCEEIAGMIFVILTPRLAIDVRTWLGGMLPDLEALRLDTWYYHGAKELVGANWKVAYDGYLEGYHFAAAHPETVAPRTPSNRAHYRMHGPHMLIAFPQVGVRKLHELPREAWGRQENKAYDFVRVLFPNLSFFLAPEMCQFAQLMPGPTPDRNRTILNYIFPSQPADAAAMQKLDEMCNFFAKVVNDEDYLLGLKVQSGLESGAMNEIVFGRNEPGNQHFHRWLQSYLDEAPEPRTAVA
jgi:phenylpropionate dioxygenase-like ring-hydroxylating dioxygenase large terminal subunit